MKFIKTLKNRIAERLNIQRWPLLRISLLFGVGALLMLIPNVAFAVDTTQSTEEILTELAALVSTVFGFLNVLLYPLLLIVSSLMDNELLIGEAMEPKLLTIWREIRNWVNIAFVLALVVIALYNVAGIAGEGSNYALKAILPKIVIGLIAVNFSFLAGKVLIDTVGVLTDAVYALPTSEDLISWDNQVKEVKIRLCDNYTYEEGVLTADTATQRKIEDASLLGIIFCKQEEGENPEYFYEDSNKETAFNDFGTNFFQVFGEHNVVVALMVNMGQATDVNLLPDTTTKDALENVTFNVLFGVLLFLMFGFAFVALALVLVARVVVLWISLALSPIVVLFFVFPDLAQMGGGKLDIKAQFFKHLFVPVVIGIVLAVGFTMLTVFKDSSSGGWLGEIGNMRFSELDGSDYSDIEQVKQVADTYGKNINDFQSLLIAAAAIIIIWLGVFGAASETVAGNITGMIDQAGKSVGSYIAQSPLYATAIPIPGAKPDETGKVPTASLGAILGGALQLPGQKMRERKEEASKVLGAWSNKSGAQRQFESTLSTTEDTAKNLKQVRQSWRDLVQTKDWKTEPGLASGIEKLAKRVGKENLPNNLLSAAEDGDSAKVAQILEREARSGNRVIFGEGGAVNNIGEIDRSAPTRASSAGTTPAAGEGGGGAEAVKAAKDALSNVTAGEKLGQDTAANTNVRIALSSATTGPERSTLNNDLIKRPSSDDKSSLRAIEIFNSSSGQQKEQIVARIKSAGKGQISGDSLIAAVEQVTGQEVPPLAQETTPATGGGTGGGTAGTTVPNPPAE